MVNKFSNIKSRVLEIATHKGIGKEKFFREIGMTSANFRGKAQETPLNSNAIEKIITCYPEINLHWLITGSGTIESADGTTIKTESDKEALNPLETAIIERINTQFSPMFEKIQKDFTEFKLKEYESKVRMQERFEDLQTLVMQQVSKKSG